HVLTTAELTPKQIVRNIESALIAHLAMRIDHRKISVATTNETKPKLLPEEARPPSGPGLVGPAGSGIGESSEIQGGHQQRVGQQGSVPSQRTGPFARRLYF